MTTNYMSNYTYGINAYDEIPEVAKPYGIKKLSSSEASVLWRQPNRRQEKHLKDPGLR